MVSLDPRLPCHEGLSLDRPCHALACHDASQSRSGRWRNHRRLHGRLCGPSPLRPSSLLCPDRSVIDPAACIHKLYIQHPIFECQNVTTCLAFVYMSWIFRPGICSHVYTCVCACLYKCLHSHLTGAVQRIYPAQLHMENAPPQGQVPRAPASTHAHTHAHARTHARTHACARASTRMHAHQHACTHAHTGTHARTKARMYMRTQSTRVMHTAQTRRMHG